MKAAPLALAFLGALLPPAAAADGDTNRLRAIGQGRALFLTHCVACHGLDGRGGTGGADLSRIEARDGAFDPVHVAKHVDGRRVDGARPRRMPFWGDRFARSWPRGEAWAAAQVWKITRYLDFIQESSPPERATDRPPGR
jgi:mono/diheme cytochrome c family protein